MQHHVFIVFDKLCTAWEPYRTSIQYARLTLMQTHFEQNEQ